MGGLGLSGRDRKVLDLRAHTGCLRFWRGQHQIGELDSGWLVAGMGQAGRVEEQKAEELGERSAFMHSNHVA